jgi:hypothetical protein
MGIQSGIALAFLTFAWSAPAFADTADLETGYRIAAEHVQRHAKDFWLDGTPQGEHALSRAWTLLADWTAAYLNEHPDATPKRLKRAAPGGDLDVLSLGPRTVLVSAAVDNAFGTIFIVDGSEGTYRAVWSIRGRRSRDAFPLLGAWTARAAGTTCRQNQRDDDNGAMCGSLGGSILRLSDDAAGHPRFFIDAGYSEIAGMTELEQMSIWTWTGRTAQPLIVSTFGANLEDDGPRFDGTLLKVRLGESYRMIPPAWDHLERELDWVFRLDPDRIEDLGKAPLAPEVDVVDELLFRAAHHLSADGLAAPQVEEAVGKLFRDLSAQSEDGEPSFSMSGSPVVRHRDGKTLVCLPTDEPGTLTFTLTGAFVSGLSVAPNETGDGCSSGKP